MATYDADKQYRHDAQYSTISNSFVLPTKELDMLLGVLLIHVIEP